MDHRERDNRILTARAWTPTELSTCARHAKSAADILGALRSRPLPASEPELEPLLRILMGAARRLNEDLDDMASAIDLWREVYRAGTPATHGHVLGVMMSVARKRSDVSLPKDQRDVAASIALYEAVHGLHDSPDQDIRVVRTMMSVANLMTDMSLPAAALDVDGAVALWRSVYRLEASDSGRNRIVRTMMDIANRLTDLGSPGGPKDLGAAIRIWRAVHVLPVSDDDRQRVVRTMMDLANRLSDARAPRSRRDCAAAVLVWRAVYEMTRGDEEGGLRAIKTMMLAANVLTDTSGAAEDLDVDGAITIWSAVATMADAPEDRDRALRTMMDVASRLVSEPTDRSRVQAALELWQAVHRHALTGLDQRRVLKTIMDIGARDDRVRAAAIAALEGDTVRSFEAPFRAEVLAGLLYYAGRYETVIETIRAEADAGAALIALEAEALRKLDQHAEAIDACSGLIDELLPQEHASAADADALVSALCCRGYCRWEQGRSREELLSDAEADLKMAIAVAARHNLPVPPRAHSGLGYIYEHLGRGVAADAAFRQAAEVDPDNPKASQARGRR